MTNTEPKESWEIAWRKMQEDGSFCGIAVDGSIEFIRQVRREAQEEMLKWLTTMISPDNVLICDGTVIKNRLQALRTKEEPNQ
jgi:predicted RNase H-like nuclease